ncbi:MAG: L-fucose:H+ symporter permease [Bacteroidetes bacterium]|nr:MAG: L-fucose:H+ symporter permease [Bacteroidota bacterium]
MLTTKKLMPAFILITALFFMWGLAHNLNPILIPHLKKACRLTDLQSAFIDSAFFIGYFVMALPAGFAMKKWGYKSGIIIGLLLFAFGALLFYPAASARTFGLFLLALFIIASGLTFLETAANPYITVLGSAETATQRLNFSQSFNGLAATLAPFLGGIFILSGKEITDAQLAAMNPADAEALLQSEAATVQVPYLVIAGLVLLLALVVWKSALPEIQEPAAEVIDAEAASGTIFSDLNKPSAPAAANGDARSRSIFKQANLMRGVLAQFFYVGAQVCITSFFIRFASKAAQIDEKTAALYLSLALLAFMVGRFAGTYFMQFVAAARLLVLYCIACVVLLALAITLGGQFALYALIGVCFFISIMFPTIFSLGIVGLGGQTKLGSSLIIMAIAGGALMPVIMGRVSDLYSIQIAYIVPLICFVPIVWFALRAPRVENGLSAVH